jgi:hypothetical protein
MLIKWKIFTKWYINTHKIKCKVWYSLKSYISIFKAKFFKLSWEFSVVLNSNIPNFSISIPNDCIITFSRVSFDSILYLRVIEVAKLDWKILFWNELKNNLWRLFFLLLLLIFLLPLRLTILFFLLIASFVELLFIVFWILILS